MTLTAPAATAGNLLRHWRQRRRLTQMELSLRASVSSRHLSFVETGRSTPSRAMLLGLAEHLDVPLRERNALLTAAGYAPVYPEHELDAPQMEAVRAAINGLLASHEPYPALVVDRWWNLVAANVSIGLLTEGVAPELLSPPMNVLRASLHPDGLAPRIRNRGQWRAHVLTRLQRQIDRTADPELERLHAELTGYQGGTDATHPFNAIAVPLIVSTPAGDLHLLSTVTSFGTALDITLADLSIESFLPADPTTRARLQSAHSDI